MRGTQGREQHAGEVDVGEVQALFAPVVDPLAGQETVKVHLPQSDRVGLAVAAVDGGHGRQMRLVRDRRQSPHRRRDRPSEIRGVHRLGDIEASQVAGDILADVSEGQVLVQRARLGDLQNLRAEVGHDHLALDRVGPVDRVLEHDVRVAGLELDLGERLEEFARVDPSLLDTVVSNHLTILLSNVDLRERHPVDAFNVIRAEQTHVFIVPGQLEGDVRNDDAQ